MDLPWLDGIDRPANSRGIPSVLTEDKVAGPLAQVEGVRLRVKDVDFDRQVIIVRDAKGGKDRV